LRGVEGKVLDPHTEVVHDEPCLIHHAARQPRRHQPPRRPGFLHSFGEQAPYQLVRMAGSRQRYGCAPPGAQGLPGCASLEEQIEARGCGRCGSACGPIDEPIRGKFDTVLEGR